MYQQAIIYALAGSLSQISVFLLLPIISRSLTMDEFAKASLYESYIPLFVTISSFALERAAQRSFFDETVTQHDNPFIVVTYAIFISSAIILSSVIGYVIQSDFEADAIYILAASICGICLSLNGLALVYSQVTNRPIFHVICSLIKGLGLLICCFIFLNLLKLGVCGYIISISIVYIFLGLAACKYLPPVRVVPGWLPDLVGMIKYSAPFLASAAAAWAITMGGRVALNQFSTAEELARYTFWFKISLSYLLVTGAVNTALMPVILKNDSSCLSTHHHSHLFKRIGLVYFSGAVVFIAASKEIGLVVSGGSYEHSYPLMFLLTGTHFISSSIGATSDLIFYKLKKTILHMIFFVIGASISISSAYLLAPEVGATSAALGSLLGISSISIGHFYFLRRKGLPSVNAVVFVYLFGLASISFLFDRFSLSALGLSMRYASAFIALITALYFFRKTSKEYS